MKTRVDFVTNSWLETASKSELYAVEDEMQMVLSNLDFDSDEYLNLAITLFSEFCTLLEVKILLFDGCELEIQAPKHVLEEYDKELDSYMERLDKYRNEFIALHKN